MSFSKNIRHLRKINKLSQEDLAFKLGYKSFTTIQRWEDGTSFPKLKNIAKICEIFKLDSDLLLYHDLVSNYQNTPILGEVKAGFNLLLDENFQGFEYSDYHNNNAVYFYLKVKGDSMIDDLIFDGSLVYVRKQNYLGKNDIGVFVINDNEVTIKRFKQDENSITLISSNAKYPKHKYNIKDVLILGKVLHTKVLFDE